MALNEAEGTGQPAPLHITGQRAEGYTAFPGAFSLALKPLTVVFGHNGAGKSALCRLPLALAAGLRGGSPPGPPLCAGDSALGGGLAELRHGRSREPVRLGLDLRAADGPQLSVDLELGPLPSSPLSHPLPEVHAWALTGPALAVKLRRKTGLAPWSAEGAPPPDGFDGLRPVWSAGGPDLRGLRPPVTAHLGPARALALREFTVRQAQVPGDLGRGGEAAVAALDALWWAGEHRLRESIFADVRQILGLELRQEEVVQGPVSGTTLVGRRGDDGTFGPASQLGTGLQHALPVLVQLGLLGRGAAAPTFVFIEEPEAHLHTRAQAELGDALIAPVRQRRGRLLIETHSEALLLRLLRRVAEGALPTTDLQLWFIDEEGAEVTPREVHVDDRGEPHGWPEGWFDTAYFEAQARRRAVRGRA